MEARVKDYDACFKRKRHNYARKLRRKKLIKYLGSELRSCTTHGLPYIVNKDIHASERFFWALSFVFIVGVIIILLTMQYYRFKNTPTVTSVEMDYFKWNVSYPAITLCPVNKIDDIELQYMVNETLELNGEDIESHLRAICSLSVDALDIIDFNMLKMASTVYPEDHAALAGMLFKKFNSDSLTTSTNEPIPIDIAMTEMGMCHVINSNVAAFHNPLKWGDTETEYEKNNIDLSVYDRDFFVQLANYADVYKVYIHSPDEIVLSTTASYMSKNKFFIHFGVEVWTTTISSVLRSTPINIRKCRFIDEPISKRYPIYTYNHCILECRIKMILSVCDCIPHLYKPIGKERICNMTELQCFREHRKSFIKLSASDEMLSNFSGTDLPRSSRDCGCVISCESHEVTKDHESFTEALDNRVRISISSYPKVRVFRDTLLNTYDFILRGAGVINLCVGASIISIMELIMLGSKAVLYTVWSYLKYFFRRITITQTVVNWIKGKIMRKHH